MSRPHLSLLALLGPQLREAVAVHVRLDVPAGHAPHGGGKWQNKPSIREMDLFMYKCLYIFPGCLSALTTTTEKTRRFGVDQECNSKKAALRGEVGPRWNQRLAQMFQRGRRRA